tara:strand:- start:40 stop:3021 length:2982 start_codon:yes stop_codon:yes gene_type:complete
MPVKSFKFISPGIFINEIDNSQLPRVAADMGPVLIGRTEKGPAMRPVKVGSFSEYVEIFGNPLAGGEGGDVWRDGNYTAPTYAGFAAQAYLRNSNALTVVRLLGAQDSRVSAGQGGGAGRAGWETDKTLNTTDLATNGGAYGLFVWNSGSMNSMGGSKTNNENFVEGQVVTGALAAVWYLNEGCIELSGTRRDHSGSVMYAANERQSTGTAGLIRSLGGTVGAASVEPSSPGAAANEWRAIIRNASNTIVHETNFNFSPSSAKYIRKVFNTNPTLTNTTITRSDQQKTYWLGGTFERHLTTYVTGTSAGQAWGAVLGLDSGTLGSANFKYGFQAGQTPWIISQDLQSSYTNYDIVDTNRVKALFKFHTIDTGERESKLLKVSIVDIKATSNDYDPYGSFSVEIRDATDSDNAPVILERFSSVNLNPNSSKYIARVIGNQYITWDDVERRHRTFGDYPNASTYVRVEMNEDVETAVTDAAYLPFGSYGPLQFKDWTYASGVVDVPPDVAANGDSWVRGGDNIFAAMSGGTFMEVGGNMAFTGTVKYPTIPLRASASDGGISNPKNAYFGIDTTQKSNNEFEQSYMDIVRPLPYALSSFTKSDHSKYSYLFSLDDLSSSVGPGQDGGVAVWASGSRLHGHSITAVSGTYQQILDDGYNRFTVPIVGGYDGFDITEKEPFRNSGMTDATDTSNYAYYSIRRAIDTVADPEVAEYNLMALPGIWYEPLTAHAIKVCESRGDALAVVDIDSGYKADTENTQSISARIGSVSTAVTNLKNRKINSSYGCVYYPWVQILDNYSNSLLWAPPSIVALGTFSSAQKNSELWFAPAGFTRGGLTEGSAGLPVLQTRQRLTSKDRDDLYEANINPIATFPAEGIVIFGQKTLQITPSALDRINVRRLMIYVKKEISRMAATILFDQNVQATWDRFLNKANPFLRSVQSRLGLTDFKVVLDSSTTTPELIDRNVLYAKIFLKPARAIEFIALDFVITNTGASFDD